MAVFFWHWWRELEKLVAALGILPKQAIPQPPAESQQVRRACRCWPTLVSMHSGFKEEGKGPWKQRIAYVLSLNLVFLSWRCVAQGGSSLRCHWLCCSTATGICCRSLDNSKHSVPWICSGRLQQLLFDWVALGVWSEKHKAPLLEIKHALQKPAPSHGCYFIGL